MGTDNWEVPSTHILEQLSDTDSKGSHRSEVQLRYLLQLFMEASCLEWSLLISVLLRDAMAVLRTVNAAKSHDQSIEAVLGYRAFMLAIQNQISVLTKILETKIHHQQIIEYQQAVSATLNKVASPKPRSRKSSSNQDGGAAQTNVKEKRGASVGSSNHSNEKLGEANGSGNVKENAVKDIIDNHMVSEGSSCVVS
ncbi:hypothetical protein NQ315_009854 [Exocentrus adspersus]|uniref:Uncharacterized protein n=1 Tax=Exocentrus adspersus TaxID=1586481 RepID=A0AAV8WHN6_9CUCU|nr:hypothetical protein NQ315_009854 [Exocentrus adspersus]